MRPSVAFLLLALAGCATSQGRAFEREGLATLPKRSVALYVAAAATTACAESFDVSAPAPVTRSSKLELPTQNAAVTVALRAAVRAELEAAGYSVTASVGATISDADADLVLVVRVQPVDRFFISRRSTVERQTAKQTSSITGRPRMVEREGLLLVGQAYLFDSTTRLRLWSRDAVDLPEDGWLNDDSALLAYGVVGSRDERAAARAFTAKTFAGFPRATDGDPATRAAFDAIDVDRDEAMLTAVDRTELLVGVDTGWGFDTVGARVEGVGDGVRLDTRAIAPSGTFRVTPRIDARFPGGTTIGASVSLGVAPGAFAKSYVNQDRGVRVDFSAPEYLGLQLGARYDLYLTPSLHVRPGLGMFIDGWRLGTTPRGTVDGDVVTRIGLLAEGMIFYDLTEHLHVAAGLRGRIGAVIRDDLSVGIEPVVGVGLGI